MRSYILILSLTFLIGCGRSQSSSISDFVSTFEEIPAGTVTFDTFLSSETKMTELEAVQFIFQGDTSRLYCTSLKVNLENEGKSKMQRMVRLPEKNFIIRYDNFTLLGYSYFDCNEPKRRSPRKKIEILLLDKNYQTTDSLIVCVSDEFEVLVSGMLNSNTKKIFLTGILKDKGIQAALYTVNDTKLKFEITMFAEKANVIAPNFEKGLENLGWKTYFNE